MVGRLMLVFRDKVVLVLTKSGSFWSDSSLVKELGDIMPLGNDGGTGFSFVAVFDSPSETGLEEPPVNSPEDKVRKQNKY